MKSKPVLIIVWLGFLGHSINILVFKTLKQRLYPLFKRYGFRRRVRN